MKSKAEIRKIDRGEIAGLISSSCPGMLVSDLNTLEQCVLLTLSLWVGFYNGGLACVWGLIPPTLMSTQAYLWLYTREDVKEYEFLFVRNSQRAVEQMLEEYPLIVGHTRVGNDKTIRWLRWLGATFDEPIGHAIPFRIRKK